jgi:hypothetical protein
MKWAIYPFKKAEWHKWFAWYPVSYKSRLDENVFEYAEIWCWLEYVQRRLDCGRWTYTEFIKKEEK